MRRAALAILIAVAVAVVFAPYAYAQKTPPPTITLTPKTMAPVTFNHAAHLKITNNKCDTCHDPATPGKMRPVAGQPNPFHAPMAKAGLCVDCHKEKATAGNTKVPKVCTDCHKKAAA